MPPNESTDQKIQIHQQDLHKFHAGTCNHQGKDNRAKVYTNEFFQTILKLIFLEL
jgi:hypothetical protein